MGKVTSLPWPLKEHKAARKAAMALIRGGGAEASLVRVISHHSDCDQAVTGVGNDWVFSFSHVAWARYMNGPHPSTVLATASDFI